MTVTAGVATTAGTPVQSGDLAARALAVIDSCWRESILRCYEQIRQQAAADLVTENRFRLVGGEAVKQRTERLRMEIDRRRLRCDPIEWGDLSEIRGTDPATKSPAGERN